MNSRSELLELLLNRGQMDTDQLSAALHLTKPAIQYHLKALLSEGLVTSSPTATGSARGRPRKAYRLANRPLDGLPPVLDTLLRQAITRSDPGEVARSAIEHDFSSADSGKQSLISKMTRLLDVMREHQPKWEIRRHGVLVTFANCPYGQYSEIGDHLCQCDTALISHLTGMQVQKVGSSQTGKRAPCQFLLTE